MATILHAVENASALPITDQGIAAILRSGQGPPSHLHAIFGDVPLRALEGATAGISLATILQAYAPSVCSPPVSPPLWPARN